MYREVRDVSLNNAIGTLCKFIKPVIYQPFVKIYSNNIYLLDNDMAGRHRARKQSIQIIRTATLTAKECKRVGVTQFHVSDLSQS
jgi:hypothetical protein